MPLYEYRCPSNGRVIEVRHKMAETLGTWGELCDRAGIAVGDCDPRSPIEKLISAGFIGGASESAACEAPGCAGGGCGSGLCGGDF